MERSYEEGRKKITPLHFTLSESQYKKLQRLKGEGFCKVMYILRYAAFYIIENQDEIKAYKDLDFNTKTGQHYKVDLPNEIYAEIKRISETTGFSMSRIMRIALNEILGFMNEK